MWVGAGDGDGDDDLSKWKRARHGGGVSGSGAELVEFVLMAEPPSNG